MSRTHRPRAGRTHRLALFALVVVIGLAALVVARRWERRTPPRVVGAPVRMSTPAGDAVFLLTHHETVRPHRTGARDGGLLPGARTLHAELWRLDVPTGRVAWRTTLLTEREGQPGDLALLGAEDGTVWLFARGLRAVSATDGAPLADSAQLRASNPALAGLLPSERRHFDLRPSGMTMTTADGRVYRLDRVTMAASPAARLLPTADTAGTTADGRRVAGPPYFTPDATYAFQERALAQPGHWMGVLTDDEAEAFRGPSAARPGEPLGAMDAYLETMHGPPALNAMAPLRYRLWQARVTQASRRPADRPADDARDWGTRDVYRDIAPLPASAEFLMAGLLVAAHGDAPVQVRAPDGVLVLHRDRVGPVGRLMLTRIATGNGRTVWDATLPLGVLQSVLPGDGTIVLFGLTPTSPPDPAHQVVVTVDLATGAVRYVDVTSDE